MGPVPALQNASFRPRVRVLVPSGAISYIKVCLSVITFDLAVDVVGILDSAILFNIRLLYFLRALSPAELQSARKVAPISRRIFRCVVRGCATVE